jgi:hypothetical protein
VLIASTSLLLLLVTVSVYFRASKLRPLDRKDINRVRLLSDRLRREDVFPHE